MSLTAVEVGQLFGVSRDLARKALVQHGVVGVRTPGRGRDGRPAHCYGDDDVLAVAESCGWGDWLSETADVVTIPTACRLLEVDDSCVRRRIAADGLLPVGRVKASTPSGAGQPSPVYLLADLRRLLEANPVVPLGRNCVERFFEKVDVSEDGCWYWRGSLAGYDGGAEPYGRFATGSRDSRGVVRTVQAHHFSLELHTGVEVPPGYEVDHECWNSLCVNPRHLCVVTPSEHSSRSRARRLEARDLWRRRFVEDAP